jgi:hypothetical protein
MKAEMTRLCIPVLDSTHQSAPGMRQTYFAKPWNQLVLRQSSIFLERSKLRGRWARRVVLLASSFAINLGSICSSVLPQRPAYAERSWQKCAFNNRLEDCEVAGSSYSFTVTYRRDGKQIQVEKVGSSHECGDGSTHECGKMLITEPRERRTTWASYRQTSNAIIMRSSRGNTYNIPY